MKDKIKIENNVNTVTYKYFNFVTHSFVIRELKYKLNFIW